jgi:hypothetical protein
MRNYGDEKINKINFILYFLFYFIIILFLLFHFYFIILILYYKGFNYYLTLIIKTPFYLYIKREIIIIYRDSNFLYLFCFK